MAESFRFQILSLEYNALRAEIVQSISYQHQILLAGYGATGVFFGYVVAKLPPVAYLTALIATPYILLGMTSLWIVECNRMVRASYYIGRVLWRALRAECGPPVEHEHWLASEWEFWIRSTSGVAASFRERQHRSQVIVVLWGPVLFSFIASILALFGSLDLARGPFPERAMPCVVVGLAVVAGFLWARIYSDLRNISDLGGTPIPDCALDAVSIRTP